jgi:oligosaccharide repeat unit polymerase
MMKRLAGNFEIGRGAATVGIRPRSTTLHWWARPHAFTFFFLIPLFVVCTLLPDELFLTWKHAQNFVSPEAFAAAMAALCSFALAAQLTSRIGIRPAQYGIHAGRLIARAQYRCALYGVLCITLAAYVLLLGPAVRNPNLAAAMYSGSLSTRELREALGQLPGISSFVNLGPLYVTLLFQQATLTGSRLSRLDKAAFAFFLLFVVARVFFWSERLALLDVLIPIAIIRLAPMQRYRALVAMLPLVGILALALFFGVTEYFRSWIYYSSTGISLTEFVATRLLGYYATALNNGALMFTTFDPLFVPYGTATWFFKFPLLSAPDSTAAFAERIDTAFWTLANPEFNNLSGIFMPINDFGVFGGIIIWILLGAFTGWLYLGFITHRLMSMLLFPSWMTGVYEILRTFNWGETRYFPILALAPVVYWVLALSVVRPPLPSRYGLPTTARQ